jgi:16S rRNA (uracil1498-N3)-methyltransferase
MRDHKLIRIFVGLPLAVGGSINLNKEQSHYLTTVMRRKLSDSVLIFNGADGEFSAELVSVAKNSAVLKVKEQVRKQVFSPDITLLYAPVKNAKSEFIVQKATEMGVRAIQPVITKYTIKDKTNSEKLRLVAIESAEQCERLDIPVIHEITDLEKALKDLSNHAIILCDETGKGESAQEVFSKLTHKKSLSLEGRGHNFLPRTLVEGLEIIGEGDSLRTPHLEPRPQGERETEKYAVLIGPEGGFSDLEISIMHSMKNVHAIGLGPRILRAETAIITALALVQNYLGDFATPPDFRG